VTLLPEVQLVGGGLAEWPPGRGPRGETIAPAAFLDVSGHEALLALPRLFHDSQPESWQCEGVWEAEPLALMVSVRAPAEVGFRIPLDPARHAPLIDAALRHGGLYLCPTTPRLGINARLARDHSFFCAVDRSFAERWRAIRVSSG
jgi:hypothetical protein